VGNKGTHTLSDGDGNNTNPNEAGIFLPSQYSIEGRTLHYVPSVLQVNPDANGIDPDGGVSNTILLQRFYGGSLPACTDPNYAYNNGTLPRPAGLPAGACGWVPGISYYGDDQDTHFNALQATLTKQFTKGLSFTTNFAWQQGIDFAGGYSTWNKRAVRQNDSNIRKTQIVAYGLYQLPFGHNQQFFSSVPGWANYIIGGWQVSPVLNWSSGLPFTLSYNECSLSIPGSAPCFPNGNAKTLKTNLGSFNPNTHNRLFFNGATTPLVQYKNGGLVYTPFSGFSATGLDQIGTAGGNNKFGPSFFNLDASLQKNFPIHESIVGQFRFDAFNAVNHINPGNPGGSIDAGPQSIGGMAPGTNPRLLQFSFRVNF
jgi:hypothetical protein